MCVCAWSIFIYLFTARLPYAPRVEHRALRLTFGSAHPQSPRGQFAISFSFCLLISLYSWIKPKRAAKVYIPFARSNRNANTQAAGKGSGRGLGGFLMHLQQPQLPLDFPQIIHKYIYNNITCTHTQIILNLYIYVVPARLAVRAALKSMLQKCIFTCATQAEGR